MTVNELMCLFRTFRGNAGSHLTKGGIKVYVEDGAGQRIIVTEALYIKQSDDFILVLR